MSAKRPLPSTNPTPKIELRRDGKGKIWSHIRQRWLDETPEERVRQEYLLMLVNEYGYSLNQLDEEVSVTGRGSSDARADFLIWRTAKDKADRKTAFIVVECKSDNVSIDARVYWQGANYAQYERAKFFVTHNNRETKFWRVDLDRRMPNFDEIEDVPHANANDREVEALIGRLKVFKEDEFAKLLHECHNVIRNREKLDPAAAFDEIAKVLFVKVYVERELKQMRQRENLFSVDFLDRQIGRDPLNTLFDQTKEEYRKDQIFAGDARINLKPATSREIVRLLERYNLSDTSEDIKGIAFEKFLGRTFRGEIGQFFTPRTIVEFMIRMVEPKEGDLICDPASGSGGFLIRFFELVREQILADADLEYKQFRAIVEADTGLSDAEKAERLTKKYEAIQSTIDPGLKDSRLWKLANRYIYGTDANDRMARTSKMNMIMHGDGHGGVHHHDGFLNVNGIFEGRFDIVLTNPPFGADVEAGDVVTEAALAVPSNLRDQYVADYGKPYEDALARVQAAKDKPITSLFDLPKGQQSKIKTELLFLERCLALLKPGGRLGIVLPEGVFNNPSLAYVREFCEDRGYIRAVVSLPQETFYSSGASVKASLLFMQKFTVAEQSDYDDKRSIARTEIEAKYAPEIKAETARLTAAIQAASKARDSETRRAKQKELADYLKTMETRQRTEARALLKERFAYPIFMYEAQKVGITATGEADQNELYPNSAQPPDLTQTCLDLYHQFKKDPAPFFLLGSGE